jgi:TorA maturation chaperone TorD
MYPEASETERGTPGGAPGFVAVPLPLPQEEQARADIYGLIARLLLAPPDDALLASLAGADAIVSFDSDQPLDRAWRRLSLAAREISGAAVRDEFSELFVSTSIPKINPYGSLYLAGFLHEKPLAALRTDLAGLGLARRSGALETEDHLGALCETMRRMILGAQDAPRQPLARQQEFFEVHIVTWSGGCLDHLRQVDGARFYGSVADFIAAYFDIEREAFEVASEEFSKLEAD